MYSPSAEQHLLDLEVMFQKLGAANLKVSVEKTKLAQESDIVLNHIFRTSVIIPNPDYVQGLAQITWPYNV